jgi:hypothetical protein
VPVSKICIQDGIVMGCGGGLKPELNFEIVTGRDLVEMKCSIAII